MDGPRPSCLTTLAMLAFAACGGSPPSPPATPPIVAGVDHPALDAEGRGRVLLAELGCGNCHDAGPGLAHLDARRGPDLTNVGQRIRPAHLRRFLLDPHATEPGTTMPDALRALPADRRTSTVAALAHYLGATDEPAAETPADTAAAARGRTLFHEIGCANCHAAPDGEDGKPAGATTVPLGVLTWKYGFAGLRGFLLAPHRARPSARMPDLQLSPAEADDLTHYLLQPGTASAPPPAGIALAAPDALAAGRSAFTEFGCASCHDHDDPTRPTPRRAGPMAGLDATRGCLSDHAGNWPFFPLSTTQRRDLAAALTSSAGSVAPGRQVDEMLASRHCLGCHQRGDVGPPYEHARAFRGDPTLAEDGRVPPPLTGVGAKLQPEWLSATIAHGAHERPYLRTRMPGFGTTFATRLAALLATVDTLPPHPPKPLPDDDQQARAIQELGRQLVSEQGMNCIGCHRFAGEQAGAMGAIDLVDSTGQRLRPDWFQHFLRAPWRFRSGTLMPQFFLDGVSTRPGLGDGDVDRQIDALWHYLSEGRNVRRPDGMRRPPLHLTVGDEAVILRRSVQHTGKRAIAVGLPGGVNLTFDAESLAVDQIWWGGFVDAAGVWTSQGAGEARILGKERAALRKGPAFSVLATPDAAWPSASRRELGHEFLGYDLDDRQRPTFRYTAAGVTITDAPVELAGSGDADARPLLRRRFTFTAKVDTTLQFLVAQAPSIDAVDGEHVDVGADLRVRLPANSWRIRAGGGEPAERQLLVTIPVAGTAELTIDYSWRSRR